LLKVLFSSSGAYPTDRPFSKREPVMDAKVRSWRLVGLDPGRGRAILVPISVSDGLFSDRGGENEGRLAAADPRKKESDDQDCTELVSRGPFLRAVLPGEHGTGLATRLTLRRI